jgi:Rod binding domain-containing protein
MDINAKFTKLSKQSAVALKQDPSHRLEEKRKEMAQTFEKVFARHLVNEMTKNTFKSEDGAPASFSHYRDHITETLSTELAAQNKLGMANLLNKHWSTADNNE